MRPRAVVAGRLTEITRRRASRVGSVYLEGMESVEVIEAVATLTKLQAQLDAATRERDVASKERDAYRKAYEAAKLELERLKRGLFGQKREKIDRAQLALVFAAFEKLLATTDMSPTPDEQAMLDVASQSIAEQADHTDDGGKKRPTPKGRRRLQDADLPEVLIDLAMTAPDVEGRVRIEDDVSFRIEYQRGHWVRVKVVRPRFVVPTDEETRERTGAATTVVSTPAPDEMIPGGIAGPGTLAHVITQKFADKMPFNRQEQIFAREGEVDIDRGTMCRWTQRCHELASRVVDAMSEDANNAVVIATDATGVLVQAPERCKRGHFWVAIADRDHVFFRYSPRHTKEEPKKFFKGFQGYLQADASSVYDALFRQDDGPTEVGCWSHARRGFFWSTRSHREPALIGIGFINKLFEIDRELKGLAPSRRLEARKLRSRPVLDMFAKWRDERLADRTLEPRSPIARALRYTQNHWAALTRFLEDGRIRLDNNPSELELRQLVVGRRNWLFVGSDEHAPETCTFVSLIASCRLHRLDPERYLRDLFRVLPAWPQTRLLELSPKCWARTRGRLDPWELDRPLGPITIPLPPSTHEQAEQARAP